MATSLSTSVPTGGRRASWTGPGSHRSFASHGEGPPGPRDTSSEETYVITTTDTPFSAAAHRTDQQRQLVDAGRGRGVARRALLSACDPRLHDHATGDECDRDARR